MSDIKSLVENIFLEALEVLSESDDEHVLEKEPFRPGWHKDGRRQMMQQRHTTRGTMTKLRKGMSAHEKKHMKGAYFDDVDIVHAKTGKTMSRTYVDHKGKSKTYGQVRKEIQAHIAKHHPEQPKAKGGPVKHDGDTRSIVTASDDHAAHLKKTFHGKNAKVRIMKRKDGNKVYIDSKTKEHHDGIKSKLNKMDHS